MSVMSVMCVLMSVRYEIVSLKAIMSGFLSELDSLSDCSSGCLKTCMAIDALRWDSDYEDGEECDQLETYPRNLY